MFFSLVLLLLGDAPRGFPFESPVQPARSVQAMAHRGLWRVAPENTRPALEACVQHAVDWAEVDVRLSKDGKHVLIHNDRVDGITDGRGAVSEMTLAELTRLDAGEAFAPRFRGTPPISVETAFAVAKGRLNLYLDCKDVNPARLVEEIRSSGMERQVVIFAGGEVLEKFEQVLGTGTPLALMKKWRPRTEPPDALARLKHLAAIEVDADEATPEVCKVAQARGWLVQAKALGSAWDNEATWGRLADAGVSWIQTDWPVELGAFLVNRQVKKRPVAISCHRGASRQAPENTLGAIEAAIALGSDYVELDVRTTRDGRLVLIHDAALNRTTNGKGLVAESSFDDIRKLDAGAWFGSLYRGAQVPTLEEGLKRLKGRARFYCDAKDVTPQALATALVAHQMVGDTVVYGSLEKLKALKIILPEVKLMPSLARSEDIDRLATEFKPYAFDVRWGSLSKELVDRCHARGVLVFSDAIGFNETVPSYRKSIEMGVDLIQTDYPDRVLRAIELHAARPAAR